MTEQELISRCIDGEPQAQHLLFKTYAPKLLGICQRYARNNDEAKDMMQDSLVKAFIALPKFKGGSSLHTWLTRITFNTCLDHIKLKSKQESVAIDDMEIEDEPDDLPYENLPFNEDDILAMVQSLPPGYRAVFNLYAIENLTHPQIAGKLGISEGTSKSQYAKARKMLKKKLENKMITLKN